MVNQKVSSFIQKHVLSFLSCLLRNLLTSLSISLKLIHFSWSQCPYSWMIYLSWMVCLFSQLIIFLLIFLIWIQQPLNLLISRFYLYSLIPLNLNDLSNFWHLISQTCEILLMHDPFQTLILKVLLTLIQRPDSLQVQTSSCVQCFWQQIWIVLWFYLWCSKHFPQPLFEPQSLQL